MRKLIDRTGRKYGRLTVLSLHGKTVRNESLWLCLCDCGTRKVIRGADLASGHTTSCGCARIGCMKGVGTTHGHSRSGVCGAGSRTYATWRGMKRRCMNPSYKRYKDYGGRGITVCDRWIESFENFIADMGERPEGLTLDRKNNELGYFKENCQWATHEQQHNNTRRNIIVTFKDQQMTIPQLSIMVGVPYGMLRQRIVNRNWSVEDAVNIPRKR